MKKLITVVAALTAFSVFSATQTSKEYVDAQDGELHDEITAHKENGSNPHGVTAAQVDAYSKDEADEKFVSEEADPTVPEWAKRVNKPTYAAHEVGAVADDEIYANVSNKAFQAAEAHEHSVVWITPINRGVLPSGVDSELTRMGEYSLGAAQFNLATYGMRDRDDTIMKKATESGSGFDGSVYKFTNLFYYTSRIVSQGLNTRTYYDWWGNFFLDWDNITGNKPNADKLWNTERTVFQDVFGGVYEITRSEKFDFVSHDYGYLYTNVEWNVLVVESASRFLRSTWFYGDPDGWSHVIIRNKSTDLSIQNVSWKRIIYLRGTVRETDLSDCTEDDPDTLVFNFPSGGGSYVVHSVYDSHTNKISQVLYSGDVEPPGDYANVSNKAMTAMQPANTYNKDETDALIAANKPEYEDLASNVVWRIEADGARFFFKPVRPVHTED